MKQMQCKDLDARLDDLLRHRLPESEQHELHAHVAQCPRCASLLELRRALMTNDLASVQRRVPAEMVDGMWESIQGALMWRGGRTQYTRSRSRHLVPLLAAAAVVASSLGGYLAGELHSSRARESHLVGMVQRQERLLAAAYHKTEGAGFGRLEDVGRSAGVRLMPARETTVGTLTTLLDQLPDDFTVVSAIQARQYGYWGLMQSLTPHLRGTVTVEDGLQAGEIRRAIERYGIDEDTPINLDRVLRRTERWQDRPVRSGRT
jgi:anti-sigma factor RsiW